MPTGPESAGPLEAVLHLHPLNNAAQAAWLFDKLRECELAEVQRVEEYGGEYFIRALCLDLGSLVGFIEALPQVSAVNIKVAVSSTVERAICVDLRPF